MKLRDEIPRPKMIEIADDIIDMGVKAVTFSGGGEPLLYQPLPETLARLGQAGVKCAVITNGSLLTGEVSRSVASYCSWIRISMDYWNGESLQASRSVKEELFDATVQNIESFFKQGGTCTVGVNFVVSKENSQKLFFVSKLMRDLGVKHIKFSPAIVSDNIDKNILYHTPLQPIVESQLNLCRTLVNDKFCIIDGYHWKKTHRKKYHLCHFANLLTVIGADQEVYTCQDKAYTEKGHIGSLKNQKFREMWQANKTREFLNTLNPSIDCKHHCVADEKNMIADELLSLQDGHEYFL